MHTINIYLLRVFACVAFCGLLSTPFAHADLTDADFTEAGLQKFGITKSDIESRGLTLDDFKNKVLNEVKCRGFRCEYEVQSIRSMNLMQKSLCQAATYDNLCLEVRKGGFVEINRDRQGIVFGHKDEDIKDRLRMYVVLFDEVNDFIVHPEIAVGVRIYVISRENYNRFQFGISGFTGAPDSVSRPENFVPNPSQLIGFLGGGNSDLLRFQLNAAVGRGEASEVVSYTTVVPLGNYFQLQRLRQVFRDNPVGSPNVGEGGLSFNGVFYPHESDPELLWLDSADFYLGFDDSGRDGTVERARVPVNNRSFKSGEGKFVHMFLSESSLWEKRFGLQIGKNKGNQQVVNIVEILPVVLQPEEEASQKVRVASQELFDGLSVSKYKKDRKHYLNLSMSPGSLQGYESERISLRITSNKKVVESNLTVSELLREGGITFELPRGFKNAINLRVQSVEQRSFEAFADAVEDSNPAYTTLPSFANSWFEAFDVVVDLNRSKEVESVQFNQIYR